MRPELVVAASKNPLPSFLTQGFILDFQLGGDDVPVINKSHLGGSGGMLPQLSFKTSKAVI